MATDNREGAIARCVHGYRVSDDDLTVQECIDRHASSEGQGVHPRQPSQSDAAARTEATLPDPGSKGARGLQKPGPSEDYKKLLRGEITSEEYVRRLKADVDHRLKEWNAREALPRG